MKLEIFKKRYLLIDVPSKVNQKTSHNAKNCINVLKTTYKYKHQTIKYTKYTIMYIRNTLPAIKVSHFTEIILIPNLFFCDPQDFRIVQIKSGLYLSSDK